MDKLPEDPGFRIGPLQIPCLSDLRSLTTGQYDSCIFVIGQLKQDPLFTFVPTLRIHVTYAMLVCCKNHLKLKVTALNVQLRRQIPLLLYNVYFVHVPQHPPENEIEIHGHRMNDFIV